MAKKTAARELRDSIKEQIPAAGTNETLLTMQSVLGKMAHEVQTNTEPKEKEQLRDAFNKGVIYGMLLASTKNSVEYTYNGFDQYFKDKYGDKA